MSNYADGQAERLVNAISVDVEDYFQVAALSKAVKRDEWSAQQLRVETISNNLSNMRVSIVCLSSKMTRCKGTP